MTTDNLLPRPRLDSRESWLDWLAINPGKAALFFDDGAGRKILHRAGERHPIASTVKLLHLSALTEAAASGRIGVLDRVPLAEWDRYHLPGTDGGARARAFDALGLQRAGESAADGRAGGPLLALAKAMIAFSDNSAADLLLHRLGPEQLVLAGQRHGWAEPDVRSLLGELLLLVEEEPLAERGTGERRLRGYELRDRYLADPRFRDAVRARAAITVSRGPYPEQCRWAAGGPAGSAGDLGRLLGSIAAGAVAGDEPSALAQRFLEVADSRSSVPGVVGVGFKGGAVPGVLSAAVNVRWADGRTGAAALVATGLDRTGYVSGVGSGSLPALLRSALTGGTWAERLRDGLGASARTTDGSGTG
ncbi:serine hydrolase [Kitasatospora sp. NPDC047058]|uniref:serine hydrolase n=1 Tax=Kitasatospora sp. NPDC047058 TaxID=3155620 RepID=UPI0033D9A77D